MEDVILKADKLSKWYGPVIGLNEISWEFEGGIMGLLGPNGAGKSTFIKLMTGQLWPSKGRIRVLGENPINNSAIFSRIGFAPEQDLSYLYLAAIDFLTLVGKMHGYGSQEARKKGEEALERVGLKDVQDNLMGTYSKGMRQRVKIARAFFHDPELLILDEPLSGTDPVGRRVMLEFFRDYTSDNDRHIIISSHVLHEIESLTDQVVLINKGKIRASGSVPEIRGLMDEFPHRIRFQVNRPRDMASRLIQEKAIRGVSLKEDGKTFIVEAVDPETFYKQIASLITELELEVTEIYSEDDNLESVFRYLVEGRG